MGGGGNRTDFWEGLLPEMLTQGKSSKGPVDNHLILLVSPSGFEPETH
jgi:hypothetical protein